ncbi:CGG triplet repeat-binding protein 1-like [Thrips palmi]|uniref:CGG triplet repeat-binding protein 1-like n=1 Tax=Thrips palmi TaxID=161013 RepID=A0A6P9A6R1_THRPL|nr:CGG triplet repeat-binding protein 1-like [Thrips palmi]
MYVFDRANKIMMCRVCDCRVAWERKSVVDLHCDSNAHKQKKEKDKQDRANKRQASVADSFERAKKAKIDREVFVKSTVHAFVKANIPLHKLDHPEMRKWLKNYMPGSGDLPGSAWLRSHYLPKIKADYDEELKETLKGRKVVVLTDETTNRKGDPA